MTDLAPVVNTLLTERHHAKTIPDRTSRPPPSTATADEFLKEAYRINSHIVSLLSYLHSIRHSYLSTGATGAGAGAGTTGTHRQHRAPISPISTPTTPTWSSHRQQHHQRTLTPLTDTDRDSIDSSTALLLRDLSASISNLSSAELLRQETEQTLFRKKYASSLLFRWAGGGGAFSAGDVASTKRAEEQLQAEETSRALKTVRENVLWYLRRGLESAAEVQRGMVEKRIERVRERERSVLYKVETQPGRYHHRRDSSGGRIPAGERVATIPPSGDVGAGVSVSGITLDEREKAEIESQLTPAQLQLFAEENESILKTYEDQLGKVQHAEKSLLEISSLQQTLVTHLGTQEEYIGQLVTDAMSTESNVGQGNRELKRAAERRSSAQMVFWATVGLCTTLVLWDLVF